MVVSEELKNVRTDLGFYVELIKSLVVHSSSANYIFSLFPYLSLFTVESYSFMNKHFPSYATILKNDHIDIIRSSRMRVKFFDDSSTQVSGLLDLMNKIREQQEQFYIHGHKGFLAAFTKILRSDLSIIIYDSHIIETTHTKLLMTGYHLQENYESRNFSNAMHLVAKDVGAYIRVLSNLPEFPPITLNAFAYQIDESKGKICDVKSRRFLSQIFNGADSIEVNMSLLFLLSQVNFCLFIFSNFFSETCVTLFKVKFLLLYHLRSSLQKLQNYCYPKNILTDQSKDYFKLLLKNEDLKAIGSMKALRDVFIHYSFIGNAKTESHGFDLVKLIESSFASMSFEEIKVLVDAQLFIVSETLEEWSNWNLPEYGCEQWNV